MALSDRVKHWLKPKSQVHLAPEDVPLLVPAPWSGSVEHFYHFLLGYFAPLTLCIDELQLIRATVRDCGPMNSWFSLLQTRIDFEVIPSGLMLNRLVREDQPGIILPTMDDPSEFSAVQISQFVHTIKELAGVSRKSVSPEVRITVLDRGPGDPFFDSDQAEVAESGATRRSLPNIVDIAQSLQHLGSVNLIEIADLNPNEQIQLISSTDVLIAQHGAGLAHMIWLEPGSSVLEIQPPQYPSEQTMFGNLASAMNLNFTLIPQQDDHSPVEEKLISTSVERLLSKPNTAM